MSNITTKTYLDYQGLDYLVKNHIIDRNIATHIGDIIYCSSYNENTGIKNYSALHTQQKVYDATGTLSEYYLLAYQKYTDVQSPTMPYAIPEYISLNSFGFLINPMTTAGDLIIGGLNGAPTRLAKGSNGQVLKVNSSGQVVWSTDEGLSNPMTAQYDIIIGDSPSGGVAAPIRLAKGSNYQMLGISSSGVLGYRHLNNLSFDLSNDMLGEFSPTGYIASGATSIVGILFDDENSFSVTETSGVITLALISTVVRSCQITGSNNPSITDGTLTLPDIQSIPNTGTNSIDSLFS